MASHPKTTAQKGELGNFFEDFAPGQVWKCPTPRTLGLGEVAAYIAATGDRTPRYCGPEGLVHPLIVFHTVLGQTVRVISLNARANLGYAGMRWLAPARLGDTLTTTAEIVGVRENSNKKTGIAYVRTVSKNQKGEPVMEYLRWVMVLKRGSEPTPYLEKPVLPELPPEVRAAELPSFSGDSSSVKGSGGKYFFEDYRVGERVLHWDGHTVNPSDHMAFTRLFQNSAKIHFDARRTEGKPLVYGGYPISVGYAQAFNGFENRLGICAVNAGSHSNPVHAGDTLYSFTELLAAHDPGAKSPVGALRLRLVVVKNEDPNTLEGYAITEKGEGGAQVYRPSVVLDLDYWEWMKKSG